MSRTQNSLIVVGFLLFVPFVVSAGGQAEEDVTISIWHYFEPGTHFIDEAVSRWNEEHGEQFRVEDRFIPFGDLRREVSQAVLVGDVPDIFIVDNPDHASFASEGVLADITEQVEQWGQIHEYFDGPRESVMYDGRYYGVPDNSNTLALYYNLDMFEEAGLDGPPETWAELREYAEALADPDAGRYGIGFSAIGTEEGTFQLLPFIQQAGADIDSLDSEGGIEALQFLAELVEAELTSPEVVNQTQTEVAGQFSAGNYAMVIGGPWSLDSVRADADFEWSLALLPVKEEGGPRASALGGENWSIMADSPYVDQAWEFIRWYHDEQTIRALFWDFYEGGRIPSRADVAAEAGKWVEDVYLSVYIEQLEYARARGPHPNWPEISEAVQNAIQEALTGQASAEDAMARAASTVSPFFD